MNVRILSAALWAVLFAGVAAAQSSPGAAITELLSAGWDKRPEARARAETAYRAAVEDHPGNRQLVYAYALVKMQQGQYPEAAKLLDQYLALEKQDVAAWRAKAWVSVLTKNAAGGLVELDKLSQLLADPKLKLADDERQQSITFLGRMLGYLAGPGEGAVNVAALAAATNKISDRLTETERATFEQAHLALTDEFGVLAAAKDDAQVQEIASAEKQKRERLAALDKEEADAGVRKEELRAAAQKIESEAEAENSTYAAADAPLAEEVARLTAQVAGIEQELSVVATDIVLLQGQAARERDRFIRDQILRDIDRLDLIAARLSSDLRAVQRLGQGVQARRATLAARHNQAQAGYAAALGTANKEFQGLENKLKRGAAERAKLAKPPAGNTGKVIALNKQALALTTYEAFPLEAERQRLLDEATKNR